MNQNEEKRKCTACKIDRPLDQYVSKIGRTTLKNCTRCRDLKRPKKCEHGRRKSLCRTCKGGQLCAHDRQRSICKECSDPIEITIRKMVSHSKETDKNKDRFDANNFIDNCFIKLLIDESINCHHCKIKMQFIKFDSTLCTIERLDNNIGHIKSNCVLACKKCNTTRAGQK
jgi:hypothetical protein